MEIEQRSKKRWFIVLVYLAILAFVSFILYLWLKPNPNCFDGKKNQNEEDVDCGGICLKKCAIVVKENVAVLEAGFIPAGSENKFDLYGKISNPNNFFGISDLQYEFSVKNISGEIIFSKKGSNFLLPGEDKYIIESNVEIQGMPSSVEVSISSPNWVEFEDFFEKPNIKIVNKEYKEITSGTGFGEVTGLLKNETVFDFSNIKIKVILRDNFGKIIALNSTEMNTVKSDEKREFRTLWPSRFSGNVNNVEVQAEVNIFKSESFLERYYKRESFQQY